MSPTYVTWHSMKQRVREKPGYAHLTIDPRWTSFENFLSDMGERPEGHTLDRIDNTKGYFKENCRWATPTMQANNRTTNKIVEFAFLKLTAREWDDLLGYPKGTVAQRLWWGWSIERAITQKRRKYGV